MLTKETKKRIDDARDTLVGVLPLPTDQIELITIGLIYKFMDDQDEELRQSGFDEKFFKGTLKEYSWQQLMSNQISADQRVTKFINGIEQIQKADKIPKLFKEIFQNAFLKFRDGKVLQRFLDLINGFTYSHSEELGNAFEYLLKTMGSQGDNGQFRTPKNIIDFIVDVVNPLKTDTILDPACGTGGFLVSSFKHLLRTNTKGFEYTRFTTSHIDEEKIYQNLGDKLTTDERKNIEKNIAGYDNTPLMVRLARVNLYLHHFNNPEIHEYNTLITDTRWKDRYDCILANPPFMTPKGGIEPHDKFRIPANRTEILFSSYILQHLNSEKGKAGFIVPEGIIFTTSSDYVALRKWLLYEAGLWAVVSLPAGCFQPYSGVKTSILFIDKEIARSRTEVLMLKIENDGFSLNTNRNEIKQNDLPDALLWAELCKTNKEAFVKQLETKKDDAFLKKIQFLHRDEFARLDAYKSSSLAFNFCTKLYEGVLKLKESTELQITDLNAEISKTKDKKKIAQLKEKIEKANEKLDKKRQEFFKTTSITQLPASKEELKTWFDANIKHNAIDFGINLISQKLPVAIKEYMDSQRDFNLSFDKQNIIDNSNSDFQLVPINSICDIQRGGSPRPIEDYITDDEDGINWIKIGDVSEDSKYITQTKEKIKKEGIYKTRLVYNGDFILSNSMSYGRPYIMRIDGAIHDGWLLLRLKDKSIIDENYLYEILKSDNIKLQYEKNATGGVVKNLNSEIVRNIEIPLPPLETQQKIVDEIQQYQKVIDGCNLLIENYKPSFEIKEDWEMVELGEIGKICMCKRIFKEETKDTGDIPFYKIGTFGKEPDAFITKKLFEDYKAKYSYPKKGEVLISTSGTIGRIVVFDGEPAYFQDSNIVWISNDESKVLNSYLAIIFQSINWKASESVTIARLYNGIIENTQIPLPPIKEQQKIVNEYLKEQSTINGAKELKAKMELKIKEVIDKVW